MMFKRFKTFLLMFTFAAISLFFVALNVNATEETLINEVNLVEVTANDKVPLEPTKAEITLTETESLYGNTNKLELTNIDSELSFSFFEEEGYIVNLGEVHDFRVVKSHKFNAFFRATDQAHIVVVDANMKLIDHFTVENDAVLSEEDFDDYLANLPVAPPGYERIGWDFDFSNPVNGVTVIRVEYEAIVNEIEVLYYNGEDLIEATVQYGKTLTVTALPEEDGVPFSHWLLGDQIASYNLEYTFSVYEEVTLEAVYEEAAIVDAYTLLRDLVLTSDGRKIFIAQGTTNLPKGKVVEQGLALFESTDNLTEIDLTTEGVRRVRALRISPNGEFAVSVNFDGLSNLYVRSYMVIERENDTFEVIYSDNTIKVDQEITYKTVQEAYDAAVDDILTVRGVITAVYGNNIFLQDHTAGIYVYLGNNDDFYQYFVVGNEILITAKRGFHGNGLIQLTTPTEVTVLKTEVPTPAAIDVEGIDTDQLLALQSQIINVTGLKVKSIPTIGTGRYNVVLTDGTEDIVLRVESFVEDFAGIKEIFESLLVGQGLDLMGVASGYYNGVQLTLLSIDNLVVKPITKDLIENILQPVLDPGTNIIEDISLISTYLVGNTEYQITWSSDNVDVITNDGVVTRPTEDDAVVNLTATIKFSETENITLTYEVLVLAEGEEPEAETFVETFDGIELPSGSNYGPGTYTGVQGVVWSAHGQMPGEYAIDGDGVLLRRASDSYLEATFTGGLTYFSFEYRKAYTGSSSRNIEVTITAEELATPIERTTGEFGSGSGTDTTVYTFVIDDVNIKGTFTVKIKLTGSATTNRHVTIDNVIWTTFGKEKELTEEELYSYGSDFITQHMNAVGETIIGNVELPTVHDEYENITFVWSSSHPEVISSEGIFNYPQEDTIVTLSAQILVNGNVYGDVQTFELLVEAEKVLTEQELYDLGVDFITGHMNTITSPITGDIVLPVVHTEHQNITFVWGSSHPEVISSEGNFNAPATDTTVILTIEILIDDVAFGDVLTFELLATSAQLAEDLLFDFENASSKTAYAEGTTTVTIGGQEYKWNLIDAVIGNASNDKRYGTWSIRVQYEGTIAMLFDLEGYSKFSFYAARYGSEATSSHKIEISYDEGSTWEALETINVENTSLTLYEFDTNTMGKFRIRIVKQGGGRRANIDDIKFFNIPG